MKRDYLYPFGIAVLIIFLMQQRCSSDKSIQAKEALLNASNDTLRITRNSLGQESARTSVMVDDIKDFLNIHFKDSSDNQKLQDEVKKYKNGLASVTVIDNSTIIHDTGKTIILHDTAYVGFRDTCPIYIHDLKDKWYHGKILAKCKGTVLDISIENEYSVVIGEEGKFWQRKTPFVEVNNLNPYTTTKVLKTYQVQSPKEKHWGVGIIGGYGISKSGLTPFFGVGMQYNLFMLK